MGRINIEVPDKLEREFKARVIHKYGSKRGSLSRAVCEALELWLKHEK